MVPTCVLAQAPQFRQLTPNDGLASSQIRMMLQDSKGFMWLGTNKGLNRYDGTKFTVYRHHENDSTSLGDAQVDAAYEDQARTLWLATAAGLSLIERRSMTLAPEAPRPAFR